MLIMMRSVRVELPILSALRVRFFLLLVIYTLLRWGFYLYNQSLFPNISPAQLGFMCLGGIKFDISALLYINSLYILLEALPHPYRYRASYQNSCKWIFVITNSMGITANVIDFAYYQFTLKRTTGTVFDQFSHEQNKLQFTLDFIIDYWYLCIILILLIYVLIPLYQF